MIISASTSSLVRPIKTNVHDFTTALEVVNNHYEHSQPSLQCYIYTQSLHLLHDFCNLSQCSPLCASLSTQFAHRCEEVQYSYHRSAVLNTRPNSNRRLPDSCQTYPAQNPRANMCGCTLYDSPTCGHSWLSMSQPCGFLSDLLSCPYRQTYQTLIAPPYACPTCNRGFADCETMEMVQGPWGCNQLIRNHVGGSHAIPGQWGHIPTISGGWGSGPALTSGAMIPMNSFRHDHRLTGPYLPPPPPMICERPMFHGAFNDLDDGLVYDCDFDYDERRRRRKHRSSRYEYRWSSKPATNCVVM